MTAQTLVEQLMALPDTAAQRGFLEAHWDLLDDDVADALKARADQLLRREIHRSLEAAALLVWIGELKGNPLVRALGLLAEANARSIGGLGEYQRSVELYDEAASIYRISSDLLREAQAQIGKVYSLAQLGRYEEAREIGRWAGQVLEQHEEWLWLAKLTVNLGTMHQRMREDAEALALYDRAYSAYAHLAPTEEILAAIGRLEQNRAVVLRNLGQFEAAIQGFRRALDLHQRTQQWAGAARAKQNLGITYAILGRFNDSLELLDAAREYFLADGRQRDAVLIELFISDSLLQLRRFQDVLEKTHQIRERFTPLGTRLEVAQAALNEAIAYAGLHRYQDGLNALASARVIFEAEGNLVLIANTDLEAAAILQLQGQAGPSLAKALACADVFQNHSLPVEQARALVMAGRAAVDLDRQDEAQSYVGLALDAGKAMLVPALTYQCHYLLGTLARRQGRLAEAASEYRQAVEDLELLRGRLMVEFRADFVEDKQGVYEDVVGLHLAAGDAKSGLEYVERAKSRALLDLLAYRLDLSIEARTPEEQPLVDELQHLRAQRNALFRNWDTSDQLMLRGAFTEEGTQRAVQQEVATLEKQITELWHRLLIRNADYARNASLWQVRTEPIQPYLDAGTLLLEYFTIDDKPVVFAVSRDQVTAHRLGPAMAEVRRLLKLFQLNLRAAPRTQADRFKALIANAQGILRELYLLLLAPLRDSLTPYRRLIVVPHGPLHYLPWHALYDGTAYLLNDFEISYLPAGSLLRFCQAPLSAPKGFVAFGHSYGGRLAYAVKEARSIADLFGGSAYLEAEATLDRLRETAMACGVLHMATHGQFRPDNPLFSGLALDGGWLTTLDIFNLHLSVSLVTLSACETGQNLIGGGDELLGLMRAFLYAGAASLVVSLWAVEDRSTSHLMETFYRRLADGWTKGAALRTAQQTLIETGYGSSIDQQMYAHPYFWAPFILVGHAGPLN